MDIQIALVISLLVIIVLLFITELIRTDLVALLLLILLSLSGLVTAQEAFSGFASNAVIAFIAVMVLSYGIDRTGIMIRISRVIIHAEKSTEKMLIATISLVVSTISAFMQNVGSAALFLPALMRVSRAKKIPSSRILMPVGYSAILGGTLTMVGSGSLIIINDFLAQADLAPFDLFDVTPVGIALVLSGIGYFYLFGSYLLPTHNEVEADEEQASLIRTWNLPSTIHYVKIVGTSSLVNKTREDARILEDYSLHLLAIREKADLLYAPWKFTRFIAGQELALMGPEKAIEEFIKKFGLVKTTGSVMSQEMTADGVGFAEIIIRPKAEIAGKTIDEIQFRKTYRLEPLILLKGPHEEHIEFTNEPLDPGATIIVFGRRGRIRKLSVDPNFIITTHIEAEPVRESKALAAAGCFMLPIILTFTGLPISLSFLTGAFLMIVLGVITTDEAYHAIDWRIIVLIGGLIPLGIAMKKTGAADLISGLILQYGAVHSLLLILIMVAVVTTIFSLSMSPIAATAVLVPTAMTIGLGMGIDPRPIALLVGICASNSFILPTHQVNALIKIPGGYHNRDFIKAGGAMTLLFIVISVFLVWTFFY